MAKLFDLNIEEVLDHWEVEHAIREVVANALDEQLLTGTPDVGISVDQHGVWHIRDFGRGLEIAHFTLNENAEKREGPTGIIGKFGVGLKDALATFYRRGVEVEIRSCWGVYSLREATKHDFEGITTLHVEHDAGDAEMRGTDFALTGVTAADIDAAKSLFLHFVGDEVVETTPYGQILRHREGPPRVYISGVLASEEPNFLFSYNITNLTEGMKKRLNRERLNVGRTTYAERVKAILRTAQLQEVCEALADQVGARARGEQCEEMQWIEIAQRALNLLHERRSVAFVTEEELAYHPHVVDNMRQDGLGVVVVTDAQKSKLDLQVQAGDDDLRTIEGYVQQYNDSFSYTFVEPEQLTPSEGAIFGRTQEILGLVALNNWDVRVLLSETMRVSLDATSGAWDTELGAIVVKRSELCSLDRYAGTLLHEAAHAETGAVDATRHFESVLTDWLGRVAGRALWHGPVG